MQGEGGKGLAIGVGYESIAYDNVARSWAFE